MLAFTCPKCRETTSSKALQGGAEVSCPVCKQRLHVVGVRKARGPSPLFIGGCGLAGLGVSAVLVLVWFFCGRTPVATPADSPRVAQDTTPQREPEKSPKTTDKPIKATDKPIKATDKPIKTTDKPIKTTDKPIKPPDNPPKPPDPLPTGHTLSGEEICKRLYRSTVLIFAALRNRAGELEAGWGTGSLIDLNERLVLTNEHVANGKSVVVKVVFPTMKGKRPVTDPAYYRKLFTSGRSIAAKVVHVDVGRDLTLLKLEELPEDVAPLPLAIGGVNSGQALHTLGGITNGAKAVWSYCDGKVRQVSRQRWVYSDGVRREADLIESTIPTNEGNSGGPIVDNRCRLVGVHCQAPADVRVRGIARHVDGGEVVRFLKDAYPKLGKDWEPPAEGDVVAGEDLQKLIRGLADADLARRLEAIRTLGELGRGARTAVAPLLVLARNPKEKDEVRSAAQAVLPQIGAPDKDHLALLGEALRDEHYSAIRVYAAEALGGAGERAAVLVDALAKACKDTDAAVRSRAALSLGKLGSKVADRASPALLPLLDDKDNQVRRAALFSLRNLANPTPADAPQLRRLLAERAAFPEKRMYAGLALGMLGAESAPDLIGALRQDEDARVLRMLCQILGVLKPRTRPAGQALARMVVHAEPVVRRAAAGTLLQLGLDQSTLPAVLKGLSGEDAYIRKLLFEYMPLLSSYVKDPPEVAVTREDLPDLTAALASPSRLARLPAAYLLGKLGVAAAPAVPALCKALAAEKHFEKALEILTTVEILNTLSAIGAEAKDAFADVEAVMSDDKEGTVTRQRAAALCLLRLMAGDKELTKKHALAAYRILARALEIADDGKPSPLATHLYDSSKKVLAAGGPVASEALLQVVSAYFYNDPQRPRARETACHLFGKIDVQTTKLRVERLLRAMANRPGDVPAVRQAAHDAWNVVRRGKR